MKIRPWWLLFLLVYLAEQALLWGLYWQPAQKILIGDEVLYFQRALGVAGLGPMPEKIWLWPPLQHWVLGAVFRLFGANIAIVQVLQNLQWLLAAFFVRGIWLRLDGRRRAANLAAALFVLNPSTLGFAWWLWPETLHLTILLGALWLALLHPRSKRVLFVAGVGIGLALLTKSLLAPFWPFFALLWWRPESRALPRRWHDALTWLREGGRAALLRTAYFALGMLAITTPMLINAWKLTGAPMIADSSGLNLQGGLEDRWRSDYIDDAVRPLFGHYMELPGTPQQRNAAMLREALAIVDRQGLLPTLANQLGKQYFRLFDAKTPLVTQLPIPACEGRAGGYALSAGPFARGVAIYAESWQALILVTCAFGLAGWRRWRDPAALWVLAFFAYQLALFLLLHVKARFLLPFMPFFSGFAASFIVSRVGANHAVDAPIVFTTPRWIAGVVLASLFLFLAFAGTWLDHQCG